MKPNIGANDESAFILLAGNQVLARGNVMHLWLGTCGVMHFNMSAGHKLVTFIFKVVKGP